MDFELTQEQQAFRESITRWVAAEVPKSWARELERDEHNYPFALWDKFTEAGFHGSASTSSTAARAAMWSCR